MSNRFQDNFYIPFENVYHIHIFSKILNKSNNYKHKIKNSRIFKHVKIRQFFKTQRLSSIQFKSLKLIKYLGNCNK